MGGEIGKTYFCVPVVDDRHDAFPPLPPIVNSFSRFLLPSMDSGKRSNSMPARAHAQNGCCTGPSPVSRCTRYGFRCTLSPPARAQLQLCALRGAGPELGAGGGRAQKKGTPKFVSSATQDGGTGGGGLRESEERWQVDILGSAFL